MSGKIALAGEFLLLFVLLPILFRPLAPKLSPLPALWLAAFYCWIVMRCFLGYDAARMWNTAPLRGALPSVLLGFAAMAAVTTLAVWLWRPQILFGFVRGNPGFWAIVMVAYPIVSVWPQGIIYRAFFFERYRPLFPSALMMILASAVAFGFSHIIFRSPLSVALTFAAGLLFAWRYEATGSLLVSSLEHALYGCWMFTVGLGALFYHGAGRAALTR